MSFNTRLIDSYDIMCLLFNILQHGIAVCDYAIAYGIECREVGSATSVVDPEVRLDIQCTPEEGLRCLDNQQTTGGVCPDLEVRFKCRNRQQTGEGRRPKVIPKLLRISSN